MNSRLTVNAGLRYELVTPQWESNNLLSNYDPGTQSLIQATPGSLYNRALVNMPKLDFAPRFGFAYSLDFEDSRPRWLWPRLCPVQS